MRIIIITLITTLLLVILPCLVGCSFNLSNDTLSHRQEMSITISPLVKIEKTTPKTTTKVFAIGEVGKVNDGETAK